MFGYKSHAANLADTRPSINNLSSAEFFLPDLQLMDARRAGLKDLPSDLPDSRALADYLVERLESEDLLRGEVHYYDDIGDFIIEHLLIERNSEIEDELSGEIAMTNADFPMFPDYESDPRVLIGKSETVASTTGCLSGTPHPDRVYSGHQINFEAEVTLAHQAGKRGLSCTGISVSGQRDTDWSDPEAPFTEDLALFLELADPDGPEEYNALVVAVSDIEDTGLYCCEANGAGFIVTANHVEPALNLSSEKERRSFLAMVKDQACNGSFDGDFESWYGYTLAMQNSRA
jgi:hypothetical protein